jgi:hypothetical protein
LPQGKLFFWGIQSTNTKTLLAKHFLIKIYFLNDFSVLQHNVFWVSLDFHNRKQGYTAYSKQFGIAQATGVGIINIFSSVTWQPGCQEEQSSSGLPPSHHYQSANCPS